MTGLSPVRRRLVNAPALRLRSAEAAVGERHTSSLELFFDLVFAVAVTELGRTLIVEPTGTGVAHFAALFVPVWWAWVGYTFYADRFDSDDAPYRATMIAAMLAITSMAGAIPEAFDNDGGSVRFTLSYVSVRMLLILLYVRAYRHAPAARPLIVRYIAGFGTGAALWLGSLALPPASRYLAWGLGMLVELAPPMLSAKAIRRVPFHRSHVPERFGNFIIIVLGEGGALDAMGVASSHFHLGTLAVGGCGLVIVAIQWWLYFDCVDASPLRRWIPTGLIFVYGHVAVFASAIITGVGVLLAARSPAQPLAMIGRWTLCAGAGGYLLALGLIHLANMLPRTDLRAWSRLVVGAACLSLAVVAAGLPPLALEAMILALLCGQTVLELRLPPCPHVEAMLRRE